MDDGHSYWDDSRVDGSLGRHSRFDDPLEMEQSGSSCSHGSPTPSFAFREHLGWWSLLSSLR